MPKRLENVLFALAALLGAGGVAAQDAPRPSEILPPARAWDGASRALIVPAHDPWVTPSEVSGLTRTPRYDETVAWLQRLCTAAPELEMIPLGQSPEGRSIWMVVASSDLVFTPEALLATGKPTLLAQAGIHAGEIDGKDAGLMLLRDLSVRGTKRELLDAVNLLFVPILNVDGHERFSEWSRINQRGPIASGWRTNARNLNLNRDYAKLDTQEMRHVLRMINAWQPDLYLDLHVTDGADYQYDITWGGNGAHGHSRAIDRWIERELTAALTRDLQAMGHVPGPLVFAPDARDIHKGITFWTSTPRYSSGYGDARRLPTVLVENHSLKPYDQRVLGTYVLLESSMRTLARKGGGLRRAVRRDRERRPREVPLDWRVAEGEPPKIDLLGVESRLQLSPHSGTLKLEYTGKPVVLSIPYLQRTEPAHTVQRPDAYWIPPAWPQVIERLALHGIEMETMDAWREVDVGMYRILEWELDAEPYEGHVRVTPTVRLEERRERFPPGSVRIPTDQPLGDLAILLLEPQSPDSFFQWGFFIEVLQRTEYAEAYVLEPLAEQMLARDPELRATFEQRLLEDEAFAADPKARLRWFYERTPYFDSRWRLYPVARE
jgi:murein tripeptide amidase MpaA